MNFIFCFDGVILTVMSAQLAVPGVPEFGVRFFKVEYLRNSKHTDTVVCCLLKWRRKYYEIIRKIGLFARTKTASKQFKSELFGISNRYQKKLVRFNPIYTYIFFVNLFLVNIFT